MVGDQLVPDAVLDQLDGMALATGKMAEDIPVIESSFSGMLISVEDITTDMAEAQRIVEEINGTQVTVTVDVVLNDPAGIMALVTGGGSSGIATIVRDAGGVAPGTDPRGRGSRGGYTPQ